MRHGSRRSLSGSTRDGVLHADQPARESLALDVMEADRPDVDRWFLVWLREALFAKREFFEEPDGTVRLTRPLTSHLAETSALSRVAVAPVAEAAALPLQRSDSTHGGCAGH